MPLSGAIVMNVITVSREYGAGSHRWAIRNGGADHEIGPETDYARRDSNPQPMASKAIALSS